MIICIREELMPKSHSEKWLLHWGVASPDKQGRGWEGGWMQAAPGRAGFTCQPDTPGSSTYTSQHPPHSQQPNDPYHLHHLMG